MNWINTNSLQDRSALRVELSRLRRIEAKADISVRTAIIRRIQELQNRLEGTESKFPTGVSARDEKTA